MLGDLGDTLASLAGYALGLVNQSVQVYDSTWTTLQDGNSVLDAVTLLDTTSAQFQFGQKAQDQAMAIGVYGPLPAIAVFPASAEALITDRRVLLDAKNRAWLIHGKPITPETPQTITVEVLVTQLTIRPDGLPL